MYKTPQIEINKEILVLISNIDETRGYWSCLQKFCNPEKHLSTQEAIKTSVTAVSKAMKYEIPTDMTGYLMAINWIFADYSSIDLSVDNIDKLYNMIENKPADSVPERKDFGIAQEEEEESESAFGSIFGGMSLYEEDEPIKAKKIKTGITLKELTEWANEEFESAKIHPLLITSIFIAEFLHSKFYPHANSRLSRILTELLMLKQGYTYAKYCSLDAAIDSEYGLYESAYECILNDEKVDYDFWNIVYLKMFEKQTDMLMQAVHNIRPDVSVPSSEDDCPLCALATDDETEETVEDCPLCSIADSTLSTDECPLCELADKPVITSDKDLYKKLPALQVKIMKMFNKTECITISEVVKSTKANLNTVKKHLAALVEKKLIEKHGKTRGAWYTKA